MIGLIDQVNLTPDFFHDFRDQQGIGELVLATLQEKHWECYGRKVSCPLCGWLARGMKRESEKHHPPDVRQRRDRLCLRGHAPAERSAADKQRRIRALLSRRMDGSTDSRMGHCRPIRSRRAELHIGKLVAQGCDSPVEQRPSDRLHEGVVHAGTCPVSENQARHGLRRLEQKRRDRALGIDVKTKGFHGRTVLRKPTGVPAAGLPTL